MNNKPYEPFENMQSKEPEKNDATYHTGTDMSGNTGGAIYGGDPTAQERHASQQSAYVPQEVYGYQTPEEKPYSSQAGQEAQPKEVYSSTVYISGVPQAMEPYEYTESSKAQTPDRQDYADGYHTQYTSSQAYAGNSEQAPYQTSATVVTQGTPYSAPGAEYSRQQAASTRKERKAQKKAQKKGAGKGFVAAVMVVGILASGVLGFGGGWLASNLGESGVIPTSDGLTIQKVVNTAEGTTQSSEGEMTTTQIVEATVDSVVEITTEVVKTGSFSQQYIESGAGSGVIISENGYILTNNHVIDGASKITVTLKDGTSHDATLVGTAESVLDVALLKIDANGLSPVVMGDSDALQVGEKAVVVGNPLGQLGGTVTDGIVSALNRDISIDGVTMNLLQTNAAINPGNSGGGMFNGKGELVGLIVAKSTGMEVEGLGFAIPINQITDILDDLTEYGYVRGNIDLGISMLDITSEQMALMYGVSDTGVYVLSVNNGSNAQDAGFQRGDQILSVDGEEVNTSKEVTEIIQKHEVGETVTVKVKRGGQTGDLQFVLEEQVPDSFASADNGDNVDPFAKNGGDSNGNGGFSIDDFFNELF